MAKSKITKVVGIDPGTGLKSPAGLAAFDVETRDILLAEELPARWGKASATLRIASITEQFQEKIFMRFTGADTLFCVESFVMQGQGGQTLQRMIGAVLSCVPTHCPIEEIQNSTVKKNTAGHGHADKKSVAVVVLDYFISNSNAHKLVTRLILDEKWDILDALAIGIAGYERYQTQTRKTK